MQLLLLGYRFSSYVHKLGLLKISKVIDGINLFLFKSYVPGSVKIGKDSVFAYGGIGVVIHANAVIGDNCIIGQGITIGGRSNHINVPQLGHEVYLGAGCRILGPIVIGDNVIIAPNAVILNDVPSGSIVVGVPGRIVKSNIVMRDFI